MDKLLKHLFVGCLASAVTVTAVATAVTVTVGVSSAVAQGVPASGALNPKKASRGYFDQNGGNALNQDPISPIATTKVKDTTQSGDVGSPGPAAPMNPLGAGGRSGPVMPTFPTDLPPNLSAPGASPQIFCMQRRRNGDAVVSVGRTRRDKAFSCNYRGCVSVEQRNVPGKRSAANATRARLKQGPQLSGRINKKLAKEFSSLRRAKLLQPKVYQGFEVSETFRLNKRDYFVTESIGEPFACLGGVCDLELARLGESSIARSSATIRRRLCFSGYQQKSKLSCESISTGLRRVTKQLAVEKPRAYKKLRSEILPRLSQII